MAELSRLNRHIKKITNLNIMRMVIYEKAFHLGRSSIIKNQAETCVYQSNNHLAKIQSALLHYNTDLKYSNSLSYSLYRNWIFMKMHINKNNDRSLLKFCLQIEQLLAEEYRQILNDELLPLYFPELSFVFQMNYDDICQIIQQLRNSLEPHYQGIPLFNLDHTDKTSSLCIAKGKEIPYRSDSYRI